MFFCVPDYELFLKLTADLNKAVEANDVQLLKTLLQHPTVNLGVIDDVSAVMSYLMTMHNERSEATLSLSDVVTAYKGKAY